MMRMLRLSTCKCLVWVNTAISTLKHHLPMTHVVSNCKLFTFLSSIYLDFIGLTDLVELYVGFSVFQEQHYIIIQFKVIEGLCQDTIIIRKSDKIKVDNNLSPFTNPIIQLCHLEKIVFALMTPCRQTFTNPIVPFCHLQKIVLAIMTPWRRCCRRVF